MTPGDVGDTKAPQQRRMDASGATAVRVKELSERDRRRLLMHFLALDPHDRVLRFGTAVSDETITRYVQMLDFGRDSIFGVYDDEFVLVGVGHLAFIPREAYPLLQGATDRAQIAEFGVSVAAEARGHGVGSKLFERAAVHCRNQDVDTLTLQCLASNTVMMHIARKAGMEIHCEYGDANAYLRLKPAAPSSVIQEALDEQLDRLDYTPKANARLARNWWRRMPGR